MDGQEKDNHGQESSEKGDKCVINHTENKLNMVCNNTSELVQTDRTSVEDYMYNNGVEGNLVEVKEEPLDFAFDQVLPPGHDTVMSSGICEPSVSDDMVIVRVPGPGGDVYSKQRVSQLPKTTYYYCKSCDERFEKRWQWNKHKKRKHKTNDSDFETDEEKMGDHVCYVCGLDLLRASKLTEHLRLHDNDTNFKCVICQLEFVSSEMLEQHQMSEKHQLQEIGLHRKKVKKIRYTCPYCGKEYSQKSHYQLHYRSHTGEKPYTCGICSKDFAGTGGLKEHMKIHIGEKNHACTECGKRFYGPSKLKNHMRIHTGDRPYKCTTCGKGFIESGKLKRHLRIHTGEKPYQCMECGRGFNVISNLTKHMFIHTGARPYPCKVCGKAFAQKINMQVHMKLHDPVKEKKKKIKKQQAKGKQFTCDTCGKVFSKKRDLNIHVDNHENDELSSVNYPSGDDDSFLDHVKEENVAIDSTLAEINDTEQILANKENRRRKDRSAVCRPTKLMGQKDQKQETDGLDLNVSDSLKDVGGSIEDVANSNALPSNFLSNIQIKSEPLDYDFQLEDCNYLGEFPSTVDGTGEEVPCQRSSLYNYSIDDQRCEDLNNRTDIWSTPEQFQIKVEPSDDHPYLDTCEMDGTNFNTASEIQSSSCGPKKFKSVKQKQNSVKKKKCNQTKVTKVKNKPDAAQTLMDDFLCPSCQRSFSSKRTLAVHAIKCSK